MLRGSGVEWDLRKKQPYEVYGEMDFDHSGGRNGDCYDRYLVRVRKCGSRTASSAMRGLAARQSRFVDDRRPQGARAAARRDERRHGIADPPFQVHDGGLLRAEGESYAAVEAPKGEFGVYLVSDGANKPYRLKCRARASRTSRR